MPRRSLIRALLIAGSLLVGLGAAATPVAAVDGLTIEAKALLHGHARVGSWMAIAVHVKNDGPAIDGELRLSGGSQGRTRFGIPAPLPTQSDKTFILYAQPPAFGRELEISLVEDGETIVKTKAAFTIHDASQLVVGIVAERPGDIVGAIDLLPNQAQVAPLIVPLEPEDLPSRVEAWGAIDRLIWQDVDSNRLDADQSSALRGWIAGGGRLVIVGGTAGPNTLSAFPDALLPFRPSATVEVAADSLRGLVGTVPDGTADLPAMGGELTAGRTLLASGDRAIAADRPYGNGNTTLIGFDPTTAWIAGGPAGETLWRRVIPTRTTSGLVLGDDSQLVSAVSQLPSLALPPIGGLIALLAGYILLVGPINYFVLKRLDRREWAWVTMPALVVLFAVGAYAYGAALRGSDILVNEVALVRGAPGATDGTAQVYIGVFSPSRGTYQVEVPGGALLSSPISDFFGADGSSSSLDVVQSDPARVRDLAVGFGSLRTIRADTPMTVPLVETAIRLEDGHLKGSVKNASQLTLESPAVVLGSTVARLKDIGPGQTVEFDEAVAQVQFGQQLSDRVVGPIFFRDDGQFSADMNDQYIRHTIIDQLTYDPMWGSTVALNTDGPVLLAWGSGSLLPVDVVGQRPRATGNILYYLPAEMGIRGKTTFRGDLVRSTVLDADAPNFSKDPYSMYFGQGTVALAYTPLPFGGSLTPTDLTFGLAFGGDQPLQGTGKTIEPLDAIPPSCTDPDTKGEDCALAGFDGMPEVEFFDRTAGEWVRLPHLTVSTRYRLDDAARYVDPEAGTVLVRFVNDRSDGVGFMFDVAIEGEIR